MVQILLQAEEEAEKKPKILVVKENITSDVLQMDITPPSKQTVKVSKKKFVYFGLKKLSLCFSKETESIKKSLYLSV